MTHLTDDTISDPSHPYRVAADNVTATLAARGVTDPRIVADLLETIGTHAHTLGTYRLSSPLVRTYGTGLIEQAHRIRAQAARHDRHEAARRQAAEIAAALTTTEQETHP